jgi:hypothetical protein
VLEKSAERGHYGVQSEVRASLEIVEIFQVQKQANQ